MKEAHIPGLAVTMRLKSEDLNGTEEGTEFFSYRSEEERQIAIERWKQNSSCLKVETCDLPPRERKATGCKAYDQQFQMATTGNVEANNMLGQCVRSATTLHCNGRTNPPGHLQAFDLKLFERLDRTGQLRKTAAQLLHNRAGHVYMVFHRARSSGRQARRIVHGALITDQHHKRLAMFSPNQLGHPGSPKSRQVMEVMAALLSDEIAPLKSEVLSLVEKCRQGVEGSQRSRCVRSTRRSSSGRLCGWYGLVRLSRSWLRYWE